MVWALSRLCGAVGTERCSYHVTIFHRTAKWNLHFYSKIYAQESVGTCWYILYNVPIVYFLIYVFMFRFSTINSRSRGLLDPRHANEIYYLHRKNLYIWKCFIHRRRILKKLSRGRIRAYEVNWRHTCSYKTIIYNIPRCLIYCMKRMEIFCWILFFFTPTILFYQLVHSVSTAQWDVKTENFPSAYHFPAYYPHSTGAWKLLARAC